MSAIPYHVVEAFKRGEHAQAGAFVSVGDSLYTYDMKLAGKDAAGTIFVTAAMLKTFSRTSTRHQMAVRGTLPDETPLVYGWTGEVLGTLGNPPAVLPGPQRP